MRVLGVFIRMNLYRYTYDGIVLGGECIVVAENARQGRKLAMKETGLKSKELELDRGATKKFNSPCVVHNWNGDY